MKTNNVFYLWTLIILITCSITSCTQITPYQTTISNQLIPNKPDVAIKNSHLLKCLTFSFEKCTETLNVTLAKKSDKGVYLGFIEFNESGNLFNRTQMYDVVNQINEKLKNPIIIVFIHGWNHNADDVNDSNIEEFKETLKTTDKFINPEGSISTRPIVGVYLGWRGASLDESKVSYLRYLTFWERKNTAYDVGNGGVEEVFVRLNLIRNSEENKADSRLIFIGHSFGGLITYTALHHHFIKNLTMNNQDQYKNQNQYKNQIADAVFLINPAIEAIRFKSLFDIAWSNETYMEATKPMLAIVTTEADVATKTAFPIGRKISTFFNKFPSSEDNKMSVTAIGHYKPFITHWLRPRNISDSGTDCGDPKIMFENKIDNDKDKNICFNNDLNVPGNPKETILTRCDSKIDCAGMDLKAYLPKGSPSDNLVPYHSPILNIRTNKEVMSGHNDIWSPTMQLFIAQFIKASLNNTIPDLK